MGRRGGPETETEPGYDEECSVIPEWLDLLCLLSRMYRRERRRLAYGWLSVYMVRWGSKIRDDTGLGMIRGLCHFKDGFTCTYILRVAVRY